MKVSSKTEIVACFHETDLPKFHTGKLSSIVYPATREEKNQKNLSFIICRVYAFTLDGKYLVQRRSVTRKVLPLKYCDSASGHVQFHENFSFEHIQTEAWRELTEEMGAKVIYGRFLDMKIEHNREKACELAYNFIALIEDAIHIDLKEVAPESGFYTQEEMTILLNQENFVHITHEYWKRIITQNLQSILITEYEENQKSKQSLTPISATNQDDANRFSVGAIVGRFQPFHNGHLQLILEIFQEVKFIKIGIGSSQYSHTADNPFSFDERRKMIEAALKEQDIAASYFQIYPIPDLHNISKWTTTMLEILGNFEIFYSNSEWIRQYLSNHGKKIGALKKINFQRFNGTFIRSEIMADRETAGLIPLAVINVLKEIKGFERIKSL
ncbi:Nicotinamide-nucleotide adenylyltransferase [Candidatus Lokiarchaeum ossiferum]|uniref:Nicotinamide-nucleotide adenylyltransferase n=1 Tax=Candidatus Lokiarchaeum ossiferum TaxID=2951803 RepID=A0ABY6HQ77_9ARCH|nr:Nicotinamide-nucleotide adenylyltransferase [Candidatus Lokiarchaeum sp. B-35]